ncbi:hypothetical protein [Prescottella equi]|uniref:hypothetical protein n=1 Tax=Rhodococcus hoagii TaxID=43767 RepID=UPI001E576F14|nr:hypothetical protein [Prescottella equi]
MTTTAAPTTTTTAAAATTTAAPTTTRERYVSRGDSEEATATTTTTPATTVAPTTSAPAPTTSVGNRALTAAAGRSGLSIITGGPVGAIVPGAKSASGTLTTVTVTDSGSGTRGWVATASSTDFVGPYGTIPKSAVTYEATTLAGKVLGGDLTRTGAQTLGTPKSVVERTGLSSSLEIITWTPALRVDYPDGAAVGSYTGTITISVA